MSVLRKDAVETDDVLIVDDLSIVYRTLNAVTHVLRNVSLRVPQGRIVGIVGESGSGKSTLAFAAMGLLPSNASVTSGRMQFGSIDLLKAGSRELRRVQGAEISMIFQNPMTSLNPVMPIGSLMQDVQYRSAALTAGEKKAKATDMLRRVGLPDPERQLDRYPYQFSGGMRQRIAIATALLNDPVLLIADEPTTALDVTLEAQVAQLLRDLQKESGRAVLFISHNLGLVAELCDEIVVLYAGEVVEQGNVRDVINDPRHPYTRALLACDPLRVERSPNDGPRQELPTIPGEVSDLRHPPGGCIFQSRCAQSYDRCRQERPAPTVLPSGRAVRCHLASS